MDIYNSSIRAVGMAYLDYKEGTTSLTTVEHLYVRSRGGILGIGFDPVVKIVTLRQFLEARDPGFACFSTPHTCVLW